jgi:truncated hemoglobin YjbI
MRTVWRWLAAGVVTLGLAGAAWADDKDKPAGPPDRKALDQGVYRALTEAINKGADLYNGTADSPNDPAGCYRLWQGALLALKPLLDYQPEWQKAIDAGLAEAETTPQMKARAWVLRRVMDKIREDINPKTKKTEPPVATTLWERLGGEKTVAKVVDDFVAAATTDANVNFFRDGKYKLTDEQVTDMKKKLVDMISEASGGPRKYTGKKMKDVHKGMGITDAEFDAIAGDLKAALEKNGAKADDVAAVLRAVGATRRDIVEPKKPEDKKPDDKKPDDKKPDDKKPDDKKPDDKKPDAPKSDDKKPS